MAGTQRGDCYCCIACSVASADLLAPPPVFFSLPPTLPHSPRLSLSNTNCAGVELLLLVLRAKRAARTSALKCLDFATTGCAPACDRVVDQAGLKTLFALFMGKLKVRFSTVSVGGADCKGCRVRHGTFRGGGVPL